ncbi:Alpha/Beta hydrolase protein [Aspergillus aurantiobrunneus]
MLSSLLGVGIDELAPSSSLPDIGVDSLMSTEVLTEIKKRFGVQITSAALTEIPDIQGLVQAIFPGASIQKPVQSQPPPRPDSTLVNGHTPSGSARLLVQKAHDLFADIRTSTEHSQATKWTGFCESAFPKQMALGHPLESLRAGQAVSLISVLPQHEQVRGQLYGVLEFSNLVKQTNAGVFRTAEPVSSVAARALHEDIIRQYPQHVSAHTLLRTTGSRLAGCLTGSVGPLAILFQDAEARRLMGDVYANPPMFKAATMHLAQYLRDLLPLLPTGRWVKILEIGAGTGGTTNYLLSQLAAVPGLRFEYTFTDISSSLVTLARKKFKEYSFMKYTTLNIEQDPPKELLGQYDIIISTNCVHATRNLVHSCSNIRQLLQPEGILCLWLFNDGRKHALASEHLWNETFRQAGYQWADWSGNDSKESEILRLIAASPTRPLGAIPHKPSASLPLSTEETVQSSEKDGVQLLADIYCPSQMDDSTRRRPIALLIHGGGHVMLFRKDIRPTQTKILLDSGFLPVSIDYRLLCPETSLSEGPMQDVRDAFLWACQTLPTLGLQRPDISPDGDRVVAIGWLTGGHLAMTLGWTPAERGIRPPEAVLAFYCPTKYSDPFWSQPNFPYKAEVTAPGDQGDDGSIWGANNETPITGYNPPSSKRALGGWMVPSDPRSRIALHMNWKGQTLPMLLHGWKGKKKKTQDGEKESLLPSPTMKEIKQICPTAQVDAGSYQTPTLMIHGTLDDLWSR